MTWRLVLLVPLDSDALPGIEEVSDAPREAEVKFKDLPAGNYVVSVEPTN